MDDVLHPALSAPARRKIKRAQHKIFTSVKGVILVVDLLKMKVICVFAARKRGPTKSITPFRSCRAFKLILSKHYTLENRSRTQKAFKKALQLLEPVAHSPVECRVFKKSVAHSPFGGGTVSVAVPRCKPAFSGRRCRTYYPFGGGSTAQYFQLRKCFCRSFLCAQKTQQIYNLQANTRKNPENLTFQFKSLQPK